RALIVQIPLDDGDIVLDVADAFESDRAGAAHHANDVVPFGKTKYGLTRTMKVVLDLFTVKFLISYANKPIYLFGGTGLLLILTSLVVLFFLMVRKFTVHIDVLPSPLFQMSVVFIILGFQSILMGLMAELLARTYHESQQKPTYTVRKVIRDGQAAADNNPTIGMRENSWAHNVGHTR
ncbi:MAG TPA: hypothetical protein VF498_09820, partial [Anaerolineales bacterium]